MDRHGVRAVEERKAKPETESLATRALGACIEVHRVLGPGLPEKVYREAISHELQLLGIPHRCEVPFPITYKGKLVGEGRLDILVGDVLVPRSRSWKH